VALKDLASDLTNFKYNQTSPDKVDNQIAKGVDFFDDTTGGATGFTPKTDLESLYNKVAEGTIKAPNTGVRTNTKTRSGYGTFGEYNEDGNPGLSNPSYILPNDNILGARIQPQFSSDFMTTPIASYVADPLAASNPSLSNYPGEASLTWGNSPQKEMQNFAVGRSNTRVGLINDKRRGVFDHLTLTSFEHKSFPINQPNNMLDPTTVPDYSRYFSEMNGKSIHISPNGELKAGVRYGAFQTANEKFVNFNPGNTLTDVKSAVGGGVTQFASLLPLLGRTSQFSSPEQNFQTNLYTPLIETQTTLNLPNAVGVLDTFNSLFSPLGLDDTLYQTKIDLFNLYGSGDFLNTPAGLGDSNAFAIANFRTVANKGPFAGNDSQPFILRPFSSGESNQTNWESYTSGVDTSNGNISIPGVNVNLLAQRNKADRDRIDLFLNTPQGATFIDKQIALQKMNPTIESKFFKKDSVFGVTDNGLPNFHPERHADPTGRLARYGSVLKLTAGVESIIGAFNPNFQEGAGSRLAYQARAFTIDIPPISDVTTAGFKKGSILDSLATSALNFGIGIVNDGISAAAASPFIGLSNPNKYLNPFDSASPTSMGILGSGPSFGKGIIQLPVDVYKVQQKKGGTFNKETAESPSNAPLIKRHHQSAYGMLDINTSYEKKTAGKEIVNQIGSPGLITTDKGSLKSPGADKINALHYPLDYDEAQTGKVKDFIKFRFKDVVTGRFIIFRAILDGISDSVTPEYGEERYIGRPDKVYIYQGADRNVSFNFSIYPKTKQEFPILMGKLNHLIGLCYPSYTEQDMMITPFMELTLGDMFVESSGILMGLSVTVEDNSTWELDDGLQFPHYMKVACEFRHIGNNKLSSTSTKHYNGLEYESIQSGNVQAIRRSNPLSPTNFGVNIEPVAIPVFPDPNEESNIGFDDLRFSS